MMKIKRSELKNEGDKFVFDLISKDLLLMYYDDYLIESDIQSIKDKIELNSILYYDFEESIINLKNVIKFIMYYDFKDIIKFIDERNVENSKLKSLIEFMKFDLKEYLSQKGYKEGMLLYEEDNHIKNMIRQYNKVIDIKIHIK